MSPERMSQILKAAQERGVQVGRVRLYDHARILAMRSDGYTLDAIAHLLGCSRGTVQYAIKKAGNYTGPKENTIHQGLSVSDRI